MEKFHSIMLSKKQVCYQKRLEPMRTGYIRQCMWLIPSASQPTQRWHPLKTATSFKLCIVWLLRAPLKKHTTAARGSVFS